MAISDIKSALELATSETSQEVFKAQSSVFEEDILGVPRFPEEYVDLFVEIISMERFFKKKGAWHFVVKVYTDREKLTERQSEKIFNAFMANFDRYPEENLCLTVSDFIARTYPPDKALEAFKRMVHSSTRGLQLDAILVGIEVLLLNIERDTDLWKQARELFLSTQLKASQIQQNESS